MGFFELGGQEMLQECSIRNLAVIESVHVQFSKGFHVLTGETGAGKSMIIDALSLIIGGRGSAELVRHGAEKAEIECVFELHDDHPVWDVLRQFGYEASDDNQLLLRREITAQGKSSSRINGRLANLSLLKAIGEHLVNIHGQHEHQSLLRTERHLEWLDLYAGDDIQPLLGQYRQLYQKYEQVSRQLQELRKSGQETLQLLDLYKFQLQEIEEASLNLSEDELLEQEKRKLSNAEKLFESVSESYEKINQHALDLIGDAMKRMSEAAAYDPSRLQPIADQIQSAYYQLEDAAHELRGYRDEIEFNPERLQEIEMRLDLLNQLKRKYGQTIEEILTYAENIKKELDLLDNKEENIEALERQTEQLRAELTDRAKVLSSLRQEASKRLAEQIEAELADLEMKQARFQVQIDTDFNRLSINGCDKAEFLISANPGEPLRPLHKIASGGELSRIMLALKSIFARIDRIPVLVFDEVDTGVSGRAAQAIAEKLSNLARHCQVFSITHLPQVASMADIHFEIRKETKQNRTHTVVELLDGRNRVLELARMLGGAEVTETTEHHAKEMLDMAEYKKEKRNHLQ